MSYTTGDVLFDTKLAGKDQTQLADFSTGTEDPNPIHLDRDFAAAAGFKDLLQQGPMTTAHFARLLASKVGQDNLRWLDVSFTAPVFVGEELRIRAEVTGLEEGVFTCALTAEKTDGTMTARAEAGFEG